MKSDTNTVSSPECSQQASPMQRQINMTVPTYAYAEAMRLAEISASTALERLRDAESRRNDAFRAAAEHQKHVDMLTSNYNGCTRLVRTLASVTQPA